MNYGQSGGSVVSLVRKAGKIHQQEKQQRVDTTLNQVRRIVTLKANPEEARQGEPPHPRACRKACEEGAQAVLAPAETAGARQHAAFVLLLFVGHS